MTLLASFFRMPAVLGALSMSVALILGGGQASAQSVVGTSLIDGQRVELLSDRTWRLAEAPDGDCLAIAPGVEFCGDAITWRRTAAPTSEIDAQFQYNETTYAQFIVEGIGSDAGMTFATMRRIIVANAAHGLNVAAESIPILDVIPATVGPHAAETIVIQADLDGLPLVFANTVVIDPTTSVQAMTFSVGATYTPEHQAIHADFLSEITIGS